MTNKQDYIYTFVLAVLLVYLTVWYFRRSITHPLSDKEDFYELKAKLNYFIAGNVIEPPRLIIEPTKPDNKARFDIWIK